jgi:hypothetical protein
MFRKIKNTKFVTVLAVFTLVCLIFSVQVFAANDFFTSMTGKMNALNGGESAIQNLPSGSVLGDSPQVTKVNLNVIVSAGSSPYYLYVKSPKGTTISKYRGTTSGDVPFTEFNNENPYGTWQVWIKTAGSVTTVTATMRVDYSY